VVIPDFSPIKDGTYASGPAAAAQPVWMGNAGRRAPAVLGIPIWLDAPIDSVGV
jgi:hypothetical protein